MTRPTGHIRQRAPGSWEVRYSLGTDAAGKRRVETTTVKGTRKDAERELRRLLRTVDTGEHVSSDKITVAQWVEHWISIGCPGKKKLEVRQRSIERYSQLLRRHVVPVLGARQLQQLSGPDLDQLYTGLKDKISKRTLRQLHTTLGACIGARVAAHKLARSPTLDVSVLQKVPAPDHGVALSAEQLVTLLKTFEGSAYHLIVTVAAYTGARRNEILALRWSDFDVAAKTLRIEQAVEVSIKYGSRFEQPKTERSRRTIPIDDALVALLVAERERHLRIVAGVPDGADVNLTLVRLPADALIFPAAGGAVSLTTPRRPDTLTKEFGIMARARGFDMRFHDLRGTHATLLLNNGVALHTVAARLGDDPLTVMRSYAKPTDTADAAAADVIGVLTRGVLRR